MKKYIDYALLNEDSENNQNQMTNNPTTANSTSAEVNPAQSNNLKNNETKKENLGASIIADQIDNFSADQSQNNQEQPQTQENQPQNPQDPFKKQSKLFWNVVGEFFVKELKTVDDKVKSLSNDSKNQIQKDIENLKDGSDSKPSTHFEIFDIVNNKFFDKKQAENVSNNVIDYCYSEDGVIKIIFDDKNSNQEIENEIEKILKSYNAYKTNYSEKEKAKNSDLENDEELNNQYSKIVDNYYVMRALMAMRHILSKQYKKEMTSIIPKQQRSDPDLPPDYVKNTIDDYIASVERILTSRDDPNYVISDKRYMSDRERNKIWRNFIAEIESDTPINIWDNHFINFYRIIANIVDDRESNIKPNTKGRDDKLKILDKEKNDIYKSYSKYRDMHTELDSYLNKRLLNDNFVEKVLNNKFIEEELKSAKTNDEFSKKLIQRIFNENSDQKKPSENNEETK